MDYRSYVSGAKDKAFKIILFVIVFMFFSLQVYASDIIIGSDDIVFSYVQGVFFQTSNWCSAYGSNNYHMGSVFIVPRSQISNNKLYIYNPEGKPYAFYVRGSNSPSLVENISRPSNTSTSSLRNDFTVDSVFITMFNDTIRDVNYELDSSSWGDYNYFYISLWNQKKTTVGVSDMRVYTHYSAPEPTPTIAPTPDQGVASPVPSSLPAEEDLSSYTFWATCYDQVWKNGSKAQQPIKQYYVPDFVADLSSSTNGIFSYVYKYPVRIPFRVEASRFHGEGFFDASFSGNYSNLIEGLDDPSITQLVDFSTPWLESVDPISFNAAFNNGNFGFDVINAPLHNGTSAEFYFCFDVYLTFSSNHQWSNFADRLILNLYNVDFSILSTSKVSDLASNQILNQINNNIVSGNEQDKAFHDQEQQEAEKAVEQLNSGLDQLTGTLTSWEIVSMPVTVVGDLVGALRSDGSTGLTFPSFSLMGYTLWPSYTFDLNVIKEKFPVLYNALHLITGIMVVGWFIRYLWRKWHLLVGDDMPED